jgi:transcription antitermination factor NusG
MLDAATAPALDACNRPDHLRCRGIRWAVVHTHPQAERWAAQNLSRSGYVTYLPMLTVIRHDRVTRTMTRRVQIPMFSRYLFVQHDQDDLWRPIRETPGVKAVLTNGSRLQYANAGQISALRAAEAQAASSTQDSGWKAPGTLVALRWGCFQGHRAVITAIRDDIADIAMIMFGQLRNLSIHLDCLVPAGEL